MPLFRGPRTVSDYCREFGLATKSPLHHKAPGSLSHPTQIGVATTVAGRGPLVKYPLVVVVVRYHGNTRARDVTVIPPWSEHVRDVIKRPLTLSPGAASVI